MPTEFSSPNEGDIGEILSKPEFGTIFPRRSLKDSLRPLQAQTGVDFFDLYQRKYDIEPNPKAVDPESGKAIEKELPREDLEGKYCEDLRPYFHKSAGGRTYFRYIDGHYNPDKPDDEKRDYLIMEEEIPHGHKVLAIFEYSGKGKDYWVPVTIPEGPEKIQRIFNTAIHLTGPFHFSLYCPQCS